MGELDLRPDAGMGVGLGAGGRPDEAGSTGFTTGMAGLEDGAGFDGAGAGLGFAGGIGGCSDSGTAKVIGVLRSTIKFTVRISFLVGSIMSR